MEHLLGKISSLRNVSSDIYQSSQSHLSNLFEGVSLVIYTHTHIYLYNQLGKYDGQIKKWNNEIIIEAEVTNNK